MHDATDTERQLATMIAFWHGQKIVLQHPDGGALTVAGKHGYGRDAEAPHRFARDHWHEYVPAAQALREHFKDDWQPLDTIPRDGQTIEVQATMLVHYIEYATWPHIPAGWRPETPQSEWRINGWREAVSATGTAAAPPTGKLV